MGITSLSRGTIRTIRRTGPHPMVFGRLALHRTSTHLQQRRLRRAYPEIVCAASPVRLSLPAIELPPAGDWPPELATPLEQLRAERDAALTHSVDLLGSGPTELGDVIDWHRDFKSGFRWPEVFYQDIVVTRLDDDSDAKVPWELSRCHQLLALGRSAAIFEDEIAALELERQLQSWIAANPPGIGINWTNAMEVAIRAINWVWAIAAFENLRSLEPGLRLTVTRSLAAHGRHIWHNLEGSPQLRSNHYLSDIVGLLVLGAVLADDPLASRWTDYATRALEQEALSQVLPDGVDFEASLGYHGLVLELLLIARLAASHAGRPLSEEFDATLQRMLSASLRLRHPDGRVPQFGDCDSGRVLPATWRRPPTHDHLLWIGSEMLDSEAPSEQTPHEELALTLGIPAWQRALADRTTPAAVLPAAHSFADAGIHVLRSRGAHLAVRCGDVGQNGNGGHSHNDLLSFELSLDGRLLVADPGTYVYTSDPAARNQFRATASHSTVALDGEEINPINPLELFRLPRWAQPLPFALDLDDERIRLLCAHDGYRRLDPPAVIRRTFELYRERPELTIKDEIRELGSHRVTSYIQLAPGWSVATVGDSTAQLRAGDVRSSIEIFGHVGFTVEDGWVSPRFGVREPAAGIRIDGPTQPGTVFGYRISWDV